MKYTLKQLVAIVFLATTVSITFDTSASAHVTVKPSEVVTAGFQTFTINVPNEKNISTTQVKLVVPEGLKYVQPTQKADWHIEIEKEGGGEFSTVKSITWLGNDIKAGFRDEFTFSAQVPQKVSTLQWKANQTYSDGTIVSWDKPSNGNSHESNDETSGPFSVTQVVTETENEKVINTSINASGRNSANSDRALYVSVIAVVVALISVFFSSRKK